MNRHGGLMLCDFVYMKNKYPMMTRWTMMKAGMPYLNFLCIVL